MRPPYFIDWQVCKVSGFGERFLHFAIAGYCIRSRKYIIEWFPFPSGTAVRRDDTVVH